ncbi:MAG: T9SS type A sorting domain-containing protein [Ferruginibacter sp.]
MKKISTFYTILISLIVLLSFQNAHATTWYVNDASLAGDVFTSAIGNNANPGTAAAPFATLNFAISIYAEGDTIYVDAGTYNEADIILPRAVTLRGAKYGVIAGPANVPLNRGTNETILTFSLYYGPSIDNTSVDGFTLNIGTKVMGISARGLNSKVLNNIITAVLISPFDNQYGIATRVNGPARPHSFQILNNNVRGSRFRIYFDGNSLFDLPSEINFNYVASTFTAGFVVAGSKGHHYKGNVAENNNQGMRVAEGNNIIEQNTFINNTFYGLRIAASDYTFNNQILNNFFISNGVGIALTEDNAATQNNEAHFNSFVSNTLNITSTHSSVFNAKCNWYNTIIQSEIAAKITGNVIYIPFLTDGTDTEPATPGFQPTGTCDILPVVLSSFTGIWKEKAPELKWTTQIEINNKYFDIERSFNGRTFESAGIVNGRINSSVITNYNFTDYNASNTLGLIYYRLKQVDLDGRFSYSNVITVKNNNAELFSVYPNPAVDFVTIKTSLNNNTKINYRIINANGKLVKEGNLFNSNIRIDLKNVAAGVYFIKVTDANGKAETKTINIIK